MRGGQTGGHPQNVCIRQLSSLHRASQPPQLAGPWRVLCHHPPEACPVRPPGQAGSGGMPAGPNTPADSKKAVPERTALMVYKGEIRAGDRSGGRSGRRGRFHFHRTDRTGSGRWDGSQWGSDGPAAGRSQAGVPAGGRPPGRSHRSFRSSDRLENTGYHTGTPAQKTDGYIHWCGSAAFPDGFRSPDRPDLSAVRGLCSRFRPRR